MCVKLYKLELMQAQVEPEVNDTDIKYKGLIRHMNVSWRFKSGREGVMQVGDSKVAVTNIKFKGKCHTCGKYGHKQTKYSKKNKLEEEKRNKKFSGKCNHCSKVGHKAVNCWGMRITKTRGPRVG